MKNILTLLFVLASVYLSGQTKEGAFDEMNAILKKGEGKTISKTNGGEEVKITTQVQYPEFVFEVKSGSTAMCGKVKNVPWGNYSNAYKTATASPEGFLSYEIVFDTEFNIEATFGDQSGNLPEKKLMVYIKEADIERFVALLKIVSGKG